MALYLTYALIALALGMLTIATWKSLGTEDRNELVVWRTAQVVSGVVLLFGAVAAFQDLRPAPVVRELPPDGSFDQPGSGSGLVINPDLSERSDLKITVLKTETGSPVPYANLAIQMEGKATVKTKCTILGTLSLTDLPRGVPMTVVAESNGHASLPVKYTIESASANLTVVLDPQDIPGVPPSTEFPATPDPYPSSPKSDSTKPDSMRSDSTGDQSTVQPGLGPAPSDDDLDPNSPNPSKF